MSEMERISPPDGMQRPVFNSNIQVIKALVKRKLRPVE